MINILYYDKYVAVAVKPSGLLSESEGKASFPALLSSELEEKIGHPVKLYTVHRLDRDTEGIMVYALTAEAAARLSTHIIEGKWKKVYTARLWGVPAEERGRLCDLLYYDRNRGRSYVVDRMRKGVKDAVLDYEVAEVSPDKKISTVKVELLTGRTHQIRVQFASRGLPLCGDRRYGAPAESGKRLALYATSLTFIHPKTGEEMEYHNEPSF